MGKAPYRRVYKHSKSRGSERYVECGYCSKKVPRYKALVKFIGFRITDPILRKEIKTPVGSAKKIYVCPSCARFRGIVQPGKSRKSRRVGSNV